MRLIHLIICSCLLLLPWCIAAEEGTAHSAQSLPAWFYQPSPEKSVGSIGIWSNIKTGSVSPVELSRIQAIKGILPFVNIPSHKVLFPLIFGAETQITIGQQRLSVSEPYALGSLILSHALLQGPASTTVAQLNPASFAAAGLPAGECNPAECQPGWLCSQSTAQQSGVLGVSYKAVSLKRQLEIARKNALSLLEYSYGISISGTEEHNRYSNSVSVINLRDVDLEVKKLMTSEDQRIRLYTKEQCFHQGTLLSWQVTDDLLPPPISGDAKWSGADGYSVDHGVVGTASGGLYLSAQIERAYKNSLTQLSQQYGVDIAVEESSTQSKGGNTHRERITIRHSSAFKPYILGVHWRGDDNFLIWMDIDRP